MKNDNKLVDKVFNDLNEKSRANVYITEELIIDTFRKFENIEKNEKDLKEKIFKILKDINNK